MHFMITAARYPIVSTCCVCLDHKSGVRSLPEICHASLLRFSYGLRGARSALDVSFTQHLLVKLGQRVAAIPLIRESHERFSSRLACMRHQRSQHMHLQDQTIGDTASPLVGSLTHKPRCAEKTPGLQNGLSKGLPCLIPIRTSSTL